MTARPVAGRRRGHERGQPAVGQAPDPAQLRRGDAAEPHVGRLLDRLGQHPQALVVEAGAVVVDRVLQSRAGG